MPACQSQNPVAPGTVLPAGSLPMPTLAEGAEALVVSDAAVSKVSAMLAEEGDPNLQLRIYVTGGGCAGFQYGFAFDDQTKEDDVQVRRGPLTVVVDAMSLQYLAGAEIDFEEQLEGARFVIRNPNASRTCGCGSSFSV